jgi:hypothetical protein
VGVLARSRTTRTLYQDGLERFLTEARVLEQFQDEPGIVQVRDFFEANGTGYLVMVFIGGRTVKSLLDERSGRFAYSIALPLLLPVMDALQKVHATGLLHRDISPDNLMITHNRQARLLDFGAAKSLLSERTKSMGSVFKKGFTPYEQYLELGALSVATDIYALAATFYCMITGSVPQGALERHANDALLLPSRLGVAIPAAAEQALMKALSVHAQHRYQSIEDFRKALLDAGMTMPPKPPAPVHVSVPAAVPPATAAPAPAPVSATKTAPADPPRPSYTPSWPPAPELPRLPLGIVLALLAVVLGILAWIVWPKRPGITAVQVPPWVTVGVDSTFKVIVEDSDADLDRLEFVSLQGSWHLPPQDLRQTLAGRKNGSVEVHVTPLLAERVRIAVVAVDSGQRRSAPSEFTVVSLAAPP